MSKILYYIYLSPIWILTLLPLRVLFLLSDLFFFILYHIAGYRKKVVFTNLKNSFPEKSDEKIKKIARKFYKHLCDYFLESVYVINISKKEFLKRYKILNPELIEELYHKKKSITLFFGHSCNWEWNSCMPNYIPHKVLAIYRPLSNKFFDRLFKEIREKFGVITITMKQSLREIIEADKREELIAILTLYDQRPGYESIGYWRTFLNQETPVITGAEKITGKMNQAAVFLEMRKTKRGYYEIEFILINENSRNAKEHEITENYYRLLENQIQKQPEFWLWSHKRWKFKKEDFVKK